MKLTKVEIAGFRGSLPTLPLQLDQKSHCIFGENGYGKSTIADGLEFWSSGDIDAFHRDGCKLDAAVHVYASEASITVYPEGSGPLRRKLEGAKPSALEVVGQVAVPDKANDLPLLRHETVRAFIQKSAGDKKDELLKLVGLEPLIGFRDALRSAKTEAKRARDEARKGADDESRILDEKAEGRNVVEAAEELRVLAKLPTPIAQSADLSAVEIEPVTQVHIGNLPGTVESVARSLSQATASTHETWNSLVEDRKAVQSQAIAALLREGERVMPQWSDDTCPLCLSDYSRDALASELEARAKELAEIETRFSEARKPLEAGVSTWRELVAAISEALRISPEGGWANEASLKSALKVAGDHADLLVAASKRLAPVPDAPKLALDTEIDAMRKAATADVSPEQKAQVQLALLRQQQQRLDHASARLGAAETDLTAVESLLKIADGKIQAAIDHAIEEIGELVSTYYLKISGSVVYSNVELLYDPRRAGGVEFSILYDNTETFKPPQRIMSNGQLNALALAFFLARTKIENGHWRTMVLDDVVSSFGGVHRRGLLDLLDSEFSDWQILLLTHDQTFSLLAREALGPGWRHTQIAKWTPRGGLVLADGDPLKRLREQLDEGCGPIELAGIAREAFETVVSRPLEKLKYPIEYHSNGRYTGMEYLIALRRGLQAAESTLASAPVLGKLEANNFIINLAAHHQPNLSGAEAADFRQLADDLDEVRALFTCNSCNEPVWTMPKGAHNHTCRCKSLAA